MSRKRIDAVYKLIVIGDPRVGKTSLLLKYATDKIKTNYNPTIGVNVTKQKFSTDEADVSLSIWDVAGQTHFYELYKSYYEGANGIIIVYDVTREKTAEHVKDWYEECLKNGIAQVPVIITGNKMDLKDQIQVNNDSMKDFANKIGARYFETSALEGENVRDMFMTAAELILKQKFIQLR